MSEITVKDARDLSFTTRDEAVDIVIRLMEERDALLQALKNLLESHYNDNIIKADCLEAEAAIAKATGEQA